MYSELLDIQESCSAVEFIMQLKTEIIFLLWVTVCVWYCDVYGLWSWMVWHFLKTPPKGLLGILKRATYLVQTKDLVQTCANLLNKVSKNSEKNHECASQITSSIYKISWSNSSYSRSYKKDKFEMHLNHYCCQKICLFCNF